MVLLAKAITEVVEGNHYFPSDSIRYFKEIRLTDMPMEGFSQLLQVDGQEQGRCLVLSNRQGAKNIEGYVAFWKGVVEG